MPAPALLTIHDVMPETLPQVGALLALIDAAGQRPPGLLVVPGRDWNRASLDTLRGWSEAGCELLAHGWLHETQPRRLYHRVHAALLSRNVAEHLALDAEGVEALMLRSRAWFADQELPVPASYVPPAWALGMAPRRLGRLPFRAVETLRGVQLPQADGSVRFLPLPLLGFEADTGFRARILGLFNAYQLTRAENSGAPLRIGIHPHDLQLRLADALRDTLRRDWDCLSYADLYA